MEYSYMEKALTEAEKHNLRLAEVRIFTVFDENIAVRNGVLDMASKRSNTGINMSVINKTGARGFAMSSDFSDITGLVEQAVKVASASGKKMRKVTDLTDEPVIVDEYTTEYKTDPFEVDFEHKLELLKLADSTLRTEAEIRVAVSAFNARRVELFYQNSEGTKLKQTQTYTGSSVEATAVGTEVHKRTHHDYQMRGWEFVEKFDYEKSASRVRDEAMTLITNAEKTPNGKATLVLDPYMLGLTIHESTGHPTELDRSLGFEADFAGTSFLTTKKREEGFQYGSDLVNLICDPSESNNLGHYKYDDEGVMAKKFHIVENGIFKNFMTDRETAAEIGMEHSFGNSRMDSFNRIPIVRMSHLYLEPNPEGAKNFEEFLEDIPDGIYASGWKSHSIDDKRMNFQFSTEIAWKIEDGQLSTPYKNTTYNDQTPRFWNSVDAVGRTNHIEGHGPVCGKGVPMQAIWISHGGGYARFNEVNVFNG
ncbi:MAG: TldD/PmbA family protein [Candidatus Heimdallarchaeota archaeon]|nr:TldD/PmbA family protein [Candidatus Heimdallarchaeota archaeon]